MKKIFTLLTVAALAAGCSVTTTAPSQAKLTNSASHTKVQTIQPTVAVFADLQVSPNKISYFFLPSQTVQNGGFDNIVNTAVREALIANGNADVLVGLEQQVKYDGNGVVESITISGYPAKYVNFRSPGDDYLREVAKNQKLSGSNGNKGAQEAQGFGGLLGGLKLGK